MLIQDTTHIDSPDVTIVLPIFEEEESLPELARQIRTVCEEEGISFEVWMVDDGSRDETWHVVERLHDEDPRIGGLRFRRNYGKSAALAVGFEHARGRYVITMDADLQDDPAEIPRLIVELEKGLDLVSGWKKQRKDPLNKRLRSRVFNFVTRRISGINLHDFNCGLKAYRREVVESVHVYGELHRYIPLLAKWEGYDRISELVVRHRPRQFGRTKFGFDAYIKGFVDLISVIFLTRFAARPMHFFGSFGTLAFLAGIFISLWISVDKVVFGNPIGDRPLLLLGVLMIIVGVQMFTTGLIGEMIIKREMERTSSYRVTDTLVPGARPFAIEEVQIAGDKG
ncbi:MAG: glycosyltransferase family 2 protein [Rhodothermales bacterium]